MSSNKNTSTSKAQQGKPKASSTTNGVDTAKSQDILGSKLQGPKLQIDSEVARLIRQHARAHMKTEVCGVLIGENSNGVVEVQASIEALNAAQAGTHVTFTQDAWEAIYKVKDEQYPEERIVGWYHSHPGFGVFLSEHDTFIHRNFFSSPDQVAWVYDPHTDEEGCFGWIDGDIHRVPAFSIIDKGGDGVERTPKQMGNRSEYDFEDDEDFIQAKSGEPKKGGRTGAPPAWLRWTVTTLSYLSALAVGFLICWLLFPRLVGIPVNPYTGEPLLLPSQHGQPNAHEGKPAPSVLDGTPTSPAPPSNSAQPSQSVPPPTPAPTPERKP